MVIATISLYSQIHEWNRKNLPNYFEILIEANIETLKKRDPKGIYKRFMCGELTNVSGLDLEVEMPCSPDHVLLAETNYNCESEASKIVSRVLRLKQNEN
ncbi:Hypothetical protein P9303_29461 [Prochlorococcus marinus str. MIT 9303]|uniref:APS kinase domain-containing protein n=1 Tax=Prochlorococcus marinus (strain MIT 9303) TaxID=59922 RepID=A2CDW6_PROM3|nr:Hypothetical protein P9303_29461 [Prochlorococcus marinus str. MIT 9303]